MAACDQLELGWQDLGTVMVYKDTLYSWVTVW